MRGARCLILCFPACCCLFARLRPTLCDPMDSSPPGSSLHGISQARNFRSGMGCHFLLQGIFSTQGSNPHLLHWQADSLPLSHLESLSCLLPQRNRLGPRMKPVLPGVHQVLLLLACRGTSLQQSFPPPPAATKNLSAGAVSETCKPCCYFSPVKIIPDPFYCIIYNCFFSHLCSTTCCLCLLSPALSLPFHLNQTQSDVSSHHHPTKLPLAGPSVTSMLPNPKVNFVFSSWLNISHNRPSLCCTFFDSQEITLLLFLLHTFNSFSAFLCLLFLLSQSRNVGGPKTQFLGLFPCVSFLGFTRS